MENLISLAQLQRIEPLLKKHIFTELQLAVLKKRLQNQPLNSNEKTYYYKFIKPKVKALVSLSGIEEINVKGKELMLPERLARAKKILQQIQNKHRKARILLSGSFLFQKEYRDIDVFIFTKYQKEDYRWKNIHINFLPETALNTLFFSSLCQISLSNFPAEPRRGFTFTLKESLSTYELLVNEILNKEEHQKRLRDFLLQTEYLSNGIILNPLQLYQLRKKFSKRKVIILLQKYLAENLALNYTKEKLSLLRQYIQDYLKLSKNYKHSPNLEYYIQTYREALELAG